MKNHLKILALVLLVVACSTESAPPAPGPAPTPPSASTADTRPDLPDLLTGLLRPSGSRPQPPIDPRTPQQIARAACGGKCLGAMVKPLAAASDTGPIIPPAWTVPAWFIDPANSATCASDTNSGTAATCTGGCTSTTCPSGIGPLLTYAELAQHRLGTYSPRIPQAAGMTVNFLSNQTVGTDPVYFTPYIENGAGPVAIAGQAGSGQLVGTATLNVVTSKSQSGNQALTSSFTGAPSLAVGMMIVNTTHASVAFLLSNNAGVWLISQPLTANGAPPYTAGQSEVDTWAHNDAVSFFNLPQVNLVTFAPTFAAASVTTNISPGTIYRINAWSPAGLFSGVAFIDAARVGAGANVVESTFQRQAVFDASQTIGDFNASSNVVYQGGVLGCPASPFSAGTRFATRCAFFGGAISTATTFQTQIIGALLDDDVAAIHGIGGISIGTAALGLVYIDTATTVFAAGPVLLNASATGSGSNIVYGPGTFNANGRVTYPSGAGAGAAAFKVTTLNLNGQALACKGQPGAGGITIACNAALNAALLDTNAGATSGCTFVAAGGAFCNYGP